VLNWVQHQKTLPANITARRQHLPKQKTYKLTCPCCNFYATKSRKSSSSSSCPKCDKKYNDNFKLIWSEPTVTTKYNNDASHERSE
jgi:hypothetical protein